MAIGGCHIETSLVAVAAAAAVGENYYCGITDCQGEGSGLNGCASSLCRGSSPPIGKPVGSYEGTLLLTEAGGSEVWSEV